MRLLAIVKAVGCRHLDHLVRWRDASTRGGGGGSRGEKAAEMRALCPDSQFVAGFQTDDVRADYDGECCRVVVV